ncbi:hypothetical protein DK871_00240 [Pseudomonas sp. L13]|nr:hypothetical protein [Pseudomonas sp. L13]
MPRSCGLFWFAKRTVGADLCGSWLACDADASVCQPHLGDAIAGKPAPTQARSYRRISSVA